MKTNSKILVVDDDRRMSKTICDILMVKEYDVMEANSSGEALAMVKSAVPYCVLMDIKMELIDGIETLKMLKEMAPDLPVIMMSAYATEGLLCQAKRFGAYGVLDKPIDIQALLSFLSVLRKEKSILIIDDDPEFSKTLHDILQARGFRVETEVNPENVIPRMEREYKLVVLLDLKLGDKDGTEVLKDIRDRYPAKPVILVTGYGKEMTDSVEKGFQIGAYACMYKPFEIETLIEYIEEIDHKKLQALLGEKLNSYPSV
jgi:two-component system response regulator HydG